VNIFIIGATGFVGSNIVRRLAANGHTATGFARNAAGAAKVSACGGTPHIGEFDLTLLSELARAADATVFAPQLPDQDREYEVVSSLLSALEGTGKGFLFTSGTGVLGQRTDGAWSEASYAEDDPFVPSKYLLRRRETEELTRAAAGRGVRAMVVRPPLIWGDGYHGFVDQILTSIQKTGSACYIGGGLNLYSHVHVGDLAGLYQLAIETGRAGGLYHAVAGELNNRILAELVARQQGVPTRSVTIAEAIGIWGKFVTLVVLAVCSRSRSPRSRQELGWQPRHLDPTDAILAGELNGRRLPPVTAE
jgi:nucleoside-diphosphate-sugar epimerase